MRSLLPSFLLLAACGGSSTGSGTGPGTGTGSGTGNTTDQACDVSDEDKAARYFTQLTGEKLDDDHPCVSLSETFVGWVNFGWFAHDRGCGYEKAIYDCKLTDAETPKKAMADAGWPDADEERRTELLVAFLVEILDVNLLTVDGQGDFAKYEQTFTPPTYDGSAITYWASDAGGMSPEVTYTQLRLAVNEDGTLGKASQQAQFTTVYE